MTNAAKPGTESSWLDDDDRWQAVVDRDPQANGAFFYSVKSTGVYCRNVCPARRPLRRNVHFHATCSAAEAAGFRPCKRCRPTEATARLQHARLVAEACRQIDANDSIPRLDDLAASAGLSTGYFHRLFKTHTGLTPRRYAAAGRMNRVRDELGRGSNVTGAIYEAGFGSSSRFYEAATGGLGMTATAFRAGGAGLAIRFAVGECNLGSILVAETSIGLCAILLGDDPGELVRNLESTFPMAELVGGDAELEDRVARVVAFVESPAIGLDLPLDLRGTSFQRQVWEALRKIPPGTRVTYSELARRIGRPAAVRAVAGACAANVLAVAIPCHRVVRTDGSLSGYRWGIDRKQALQEREKSG